MPARHGVWITPHAAAAAPATIGQLLAPQQGGEPCPVGGGCPAAKLFWLMKSFRSDAV